ncbi:hypothetical protein [Gemmatimonas sp.]|jgi:hypothetical protein|uniref:hypothetical protein n=1 Tax=Gemmatimonas sp. TaxID=1962908 RepID=UPI0037C0FCFA
MTDKPDEAPTALSDGIWDVVVIKERSDRYRAKDALERLGSLRTLAEVFVIGPDAAARVIARACKAPGLHSVQPQSADPRVLLARQVKAGASNGANKWSFDRASADDLVWRPVRSDMGGAMEDGPLHRALRLLRLVRPNEIGVGTAARVVIRNGIVASVEPHLVIGIGGMAFVERSPEPGSVGLREADLREFEDLWRAYNARVLPSRVEHALIWHERATWDASGSIRAALVATAFESLLSYRASNGDEAGETGQFVLRMQALIDRGVIDATWWPGTRLYRFYDARSVIVHGRSLFRANDAEELNAVQKAAEASLRAVLRQAILDEKFSSLFTSEETLRSTMPATKKLLSAWKHERRVAVVPDWATC